MIEADIENKLCETLTSVLSADNVEIVSSWKPADSGKVKGETRKDAKGVVSIYVSPRANDSFSLPTVNIAGTIVIDCRAEMCPTMQEVSEIYSKIQKQMDDWHYDALQFSEDFSTSAFYATEIMLNGGDRLTYDRTNSLWSLTTQFTLRGTVNH